MEGLRGRADRTQYKFPKPCTLQDLSRHICSSRGVVMVACVHLSHAAVSKLLHAPQSRLKSFMKMQTAGERVAVIASEAANSAPLWRRNSCVFHSALLAAQQIGTGTNRVDCECRSRVAVKFLKDLTVIATSTSSIWHRQLMSH